MDENSRTINEILDAAIGEYLDGLKMLDLNSPFSNARLKEVFDRGVGYAMKGYRTKQHAPPYYRAGMQRILTRGDGTRVRFDYIAKSLPALLRPFEELFPTALAIDIISDSTDKEVPEPIYMKKNPFGIPRFVDFNDVKGNYRRASK